MLCRRQRFVNLARNGPGMCLSGEVKKRTSWKKTKMMEKYMKPDETYELGMVDGFALLDCM